MVAFHCLKSSDCWIDEERIEVAYCDTLQKRFPAFQVALRSLARAISVCARCTMQEIRRLRWSGPRRHVSCSTFSTCSPVSRTQGSLSRAALRVAAFFAVAVPDLVGYLSPLSSVVCEWLFLHHPNGDHQQGPNLALDATGHCS